MTNTDSENYWTLAEEQAFQLTQSALRLDQSRSDKGGNPAGLMAAMNQNLEIWVALRSIIMREDCTLADETKNNLTRLAPFVADRTFVGGEGGVADTTLDTLIHLNLQIAEGLLEGISKDSQ